MAYSLENTQDLTDLADAIRVKAGVSGSMTVPQMTDAVEGMAIAQKRDVVCLNRSQGGGWAEMLFYFPNEVRSIRLNYVSATGLFYNVDNSETISFPQIIIEGGGQINGDQMLMENHNTQYIPISFEPKGSSTTFLLTSAYDMFYNCDNLREIDVSFFQYARFTVANSYYELFAQCRKLETITGLNYLPQSNHQWNYRSLFQDCWHLKEINNLVVQGQVGQNSMIGLLIGTSSLSKFTFDTTGAAPTAGNWNGAFLDFSSFCGWVKSTTSAINSFDPAKRVIDAASYNALKNDPDWWSTIPEFSKYNHDSAVITINSLPNVGVGYNNVIKFKGAAGANTDGGAINTLTEAEIQVATDKGWTVQFV